MGSITIAKWLLQIKPNINVTMVSDCAFIAARGSSHLSVIGLLMHYIPYYILVNRRYGYSRRDAFINDVSKYSMVCGLWDLV